MTNQRPPLATRRSAESRTILRRSGCLRVTRATASPTTAGPISEPGRHRQSPAAEVRRSSGRLFSVAEFRGPTGRGQALPWDHLRRAPVGRWAAGGSRTLAGDNKTDSSLDNVAAVRPPALSAANSDQGNYRRPAVLSGAGRGGSPGRQVGGQGSRTGQPLSGGAERTTAGGFIHRPTLRRPTPRPEY